MMRLIEYDHLSVDGRYDGDGWWQAQVRVPADQTHVDHQLELLEDAVGLVLGRDTYDTFAATWPAMTGDLADRINSLPKYVASRSRNVTAWKAQVLRGDAVAAVADLKKSGEGTLVKYGNGPFSRALMAAGLLDELHLSFSPFVAGAGQALLAGIRTTPLSLTGVTQIGNGSVVLSYELIR